MNEEEQKLSEAYNEGNLELEDPSRDFLKWLSEAGENTFKKDRRINIRLTSHDLMGIQREAAQKGIPYQAFISGLIHQYIEGELQESKK